MNKRQLPNRSRAASPPTPAMSRPAPTLRVAAVQMRSTPSLDENVAKIESFIASCARRRVQIVAFPECAATGYTASAILALSAPQLRRAEARIAAACRRHRIAALVGIPWRTRDGFHNAALIIDRNGRRRARHLKVHLVGQDRAWQCRPGSRPSPVFPCGPTGGAVFICHDSRYPELCRLPVLAGARVLFYLSHEASLRKEWKMNPYRAQIQARAAENGVFIVHANAPADPDLGGSHGQSRIVGPDGNVLREATQFGEDVLVADLNLADATAENALRSLEAEPLATWWRQGAKHVRKLS